MTVGKESPLEGLWTSPVQELHRFSRTDAVGSRHLAGLVKQRPVEKLGREKPTGRRETLSHPVSGL